MLTEGLIVFVKNPELGKVKTRLAKTEGDERALKTYHQLLAYTQQVTSEARPERVVYYSSHVEKSDIWSPGLKKLQTTGNLGDKMSAAVNNELHQYKKVCILSHN